MRIISISTFIIIALIVLFLLAWNKLFQPASTPSQPSSYGSYTVIQAVTQAPTPAIT